MCPELEHGFCDDTVIIYDAGLFAAGKCYLKEYLLMFFLNSLSDRCLKKQHLHHYCE